LPQRGVNRVPVGNHALGGGQPIEEQTTVRLAHDAAVEQHDCTKRAL
jgi:hypothetical protein